MAPAAEKPHAQATITFGSDATNYESVHAASYKRVVANPADRASLRENSLKLRMHHTVFGYDQAFEPPEKGETCSRSAFRDPGKEYFEAYEKQQGEKADQKAALQRASYTLGSDPDPDRFKSEYTLGTSEPGKTPRSWKDKTRACDPAKSINISLGSDPANYISTVAAAHVDFKDRGVPAIVDLKERTQALRRSSFSFGTDDVNYATNAGETYSARGFDEAMRKTREEKGREGSEAEKTKKQKNVLLGFEAVSYNSEARRSFSQVDALYAHCRDPTKLDAEKKKDLRSHHFEFGADPPTYMSLGRASFSARGARDPAEVRKLAEEMQNQKKDLRSTHISLGQIGNNVLQSKTNSQEAYRAYTARELRQGGLDRKDQEKDLRGVHFILGDDDAAQKQSRSISLAQETMKEGVSGAVYESSATQNAQSTAKLRSSNFYLGNDNADQWCSTSAASYVDHKDAERSVISAAERADLRASHYQLGRDEGYPKDMKTTSQEMMVYHAPTPREQKQEESVRPHEIRNFVLGHTPVKYQSVYKAGFTWHGKPDARLEGLTPRKV